MGHTTDARIDDRELPPAVAENFRIALGLDDPPTSLGDWVDAAARHFVDAGVSLDVEVLCLTESSRHEARVGDETYHFACVLDGLVLPFVLDGADDVFVASRSPESDAEVAFDVTENGVSSDPEGAVLSFGVASDVPSSEERDDVLAAGYVIACPYINAFPDEAEYEAWAASTPDAETMALSPEEGFAVARRLTEGLAE